MLFLLLIFAFLKIGFGKKIHFKWAIHSHRSKIKHYKKIYTGKFHYLYIPVICPISPPLQVTTLIGVFCIPPDCVFKQIQVHTNIILIFPLFTPKVAHYTHGSTLLLEKFWISFETSTTKSFLNLFYNCLAFNWIDEYWYISKRPFWQYTSRALCFFNSLIAFLGIYPEETIRWGTKTHANRESLHDSPELPIK